MIKRILLSLLCLALCFAGLMSCDDKNDKAAAVSDIDLDRSEITIKPGESVTLTASVLPSDASSDDIKWYSTDKSVATVKHGVVTAVADGSVVIVCASSNGIFAKCTVTVDTGVHTHAFGDWIDKIVATCGEGGIKERTCSTCGEVEYEPVAATGAHTTQNLEMNRKESTCTVKGSYDKFVYCTSCQKMLANEKVELPLAKHELGDVITETDPTCTSAGAGYKVCKNCPFEQQVVIPALDHQLSDVAAKAPNCQETGWDAYKECTREGCDYNTKVELPISEHEYAIEDMFLMPPTDSTQGEAIFECAVPGCEFVGSVITVPELSSDLYTKTDLGDGTTRYAFKYVYNDKEITITFEL